MNSANDNHCVAAAERANPITVKRANAMIGGLFGVSMLALVPVTALEAQVGGAAGPKTARPSAKAGSAGMVAGPAADPAIDPAIDPAPAPDATVDQQIADDNALAPNTEQLATSAPARGVYGPTMVHATAPVPQFTWSDAPPATPPALASAIAIATEKDPSAVAAWLAARAALQDVKGAKWLRFPAISSGFVFYNRSSAITEQLAPQIQVSLPVFTGGRIGANINRTKALEQAAIANWREVVLEIAQQVADSYYNIALSTRLEAFYKDSLVAHQQLVETMKHRVEQEISPEADLQLARSRTAQIEQELTNIQAQRLSSLRTLAELVRDPNYRIGTVPRFDPQKQTQNWENVVAEAVAFSPTRERLQYSADAAQQEIKITRGSIFPQLNAQYSYSDFVGSRFGLGVQLQTANGLSQFSAVSAATARAQQATQQVGLAIRQLKQNVEVQKVTQEAAVRRAQVSQVASETSGRVSESYVRQFIAGRRSWLDVLNSLRERLATQSNVATAEVTAQAAATRLNLLSGRWRPVLEDTKK